jgi:U4/U6 small nuclear ribonucleoprotein PRP3
MKDSDSLDMQEQKKMRKQRRQAERQDKRDRIRMGLIPPDPPKGMYYKPY